MGVLPTCHQFTRSTPLYHCAGSASAFACSCRCLRGATLLGIQMSNIFWFIAGTLTGLAAMLIAFPLLRTARAALEKRSVRITVAAVGIAAFAALALLLY